MKHRALRIAWSVAWGIVAVLLVALWGRSYYSRDMTRGCICGSHLHVSVTSLKGEAALAFDEWRGNPHPWMIESVSNSENMISVFPSVGKPPLSWLGFRLHFTAALVVVVLPYWFLGLGAAGSASIPWCFGSSVSVSKLSSSLRRSLPLDWGWSCS